ncbi:MAG: GDSL-type esterase/lipase family protein [Gemmatimonadota bacterium]
MKLQHLSLFALIGLVLLAGELALEVRAYRRGFETLLLPPPPQMASGGEEGVASPYGPAEGFPFRSPLLEPAAGEATRIWFASSSYAEDVRYSVPAIFPNVAADLLNDSLGMDVQLLNAAIAGFTVESNTRQLESLGPTWSPDWVVLYQMTNDLHQLADPVRLRVLQTGSATPTESSFDLSAFLGRTVERATLFQQLTANVTPRITAYRLLPHEPPEGSGPAFEARIREFLTAARSIGARPILATFAPRATDPADLAPATRTWMLRWNPNQTPDGYLATVLEWNEAIRRVAAEESVPLIDAERALGGRLENYRDFAHFTEDGHQIAARFFAERLAAEMSGPR